jgi:hypothetical protein
MFPAQRAAFARAAVTVATLIVCAAFLFLGAFSGAALAVDQAAGPFADGRAAPRAAGVSATDPVVDPSGPAVTLTVPALASSASKTASFKVSWSASPALPSGGWDAFRVEYREPGVDYWLVWQQATTALSATFPGEPGHAYLFRVAAARSGDSTIVGPWSVETSVTVPADEAAFTYLKTWTRTSVSSAYFGKIRTCGTKGATATYKFKGTKAALIAPRGRALGKVAVYVRSASGTGWTSYKLVKTIDLYSRTARARVATTFGTYDPAVERQVKFVVTGTKNRASTSTKVSLDGLAVYGAPRATTWHYVTIQPSTPRVVITDPLQLTASIDGCVDQRVTWEVLRYDRFGTAYADGAGSITADGLYAAPSLPTKTTGDDQRSYYVVARSLTNPDKVSGMREIIVTLGPPPVVHDVQPRSAPAGASVTITGEHFTDHGGLPQALFSGVEATVSSATDTTITAIVPGGWQTWKTSQIMRVWVRTWGVDSTYPADLIFTVTGILPAPPAPWSDGINAASYDDDNASPGDSVRILGHGFAPTASDNVVRFGGGVVATASSYTPDAYADDLGTIHVTVPAGAASGALTFQRLDGDGRWSTGGPVLEVRPATVVTAGLHPSFNGYVTGPRSVRNASWGTEDWVLSGSNFLKLRNANYSATTTGIFWLDMRRNGVTYSRIMRAVSDTLAVPHGYWGPQEMMPDEIFGDAQGGDTVEIRIRGDELTNRYERTSPWVPVAVGERPVWGAVHDLPVSQLAGWWNPGHPLAQGDWLKLRTGGGPATQVLTCPGLWPGQLPVGTDGAAVKLVHLDQKGSYTLTNVTTGASTTFTVGDLGSLRTVSYGGYQFTDVQADGLLMRNGGASVEIPPGALSVDDLASSEGYFIVALDHAGSECVAFDTTLTDGGRSFSLSISPEPTTLLKPITVTIPYDLAGRATTPFLGMWDASSGLYYDYRLPSGQIDTTNHRMTIVLPAGDYSGTGGVVGVAAKSSTGRVLTKSFFPVSTFNRVLRAVGAVSSKVATSDEGYVWHPADHPTWGIRVDAVIDSSSSSYVPPEKAQEVLDVAADTWTNLAGKGWREPEAMISITVRDYGDPGVYQGATTKGVFGQPWVYVNSRLTMGKKLDTAVAHEMGHVFQRQLTTNIGTKWIDEATAEWIAWDTLGAGSDLQVQFEYGCDFPGVAFPSGFSWDYTPEQAYGAGAFIIWMADTYGAASVLDIYDTLAFRPSYWYDAPATFQEATGKTVPQLVAEFAPEFWLQSYEPVNSFTFWSRLPVTISDFDGKTLSLDMGADSSRGASVAPIPAFRPHLLDETMVARATGLPVGATVNVYRDTALSSATPASPLLIGTLSSLTPVLDLGLFDDSVGCYRLVAVTPPGAAMSVAVTVEPVHVVTRTPQGGGKTGGYAVTLDGFGFGDQPGFVMMGAAMVRGSAITSWTDTRIVFTMPDMGETTGEQVVQVQPVIGGISNGVTFTVF